MADVSSQSVREKRPSLLKGLIFLVVLALVGFGLVAAAMTLRSEEGPLVQTKTPEAVSVRIETAKLQDSFVLNESFTGLTTARRTSQLGFASGGRIAAISADVGQNVRSGQTLARLDTRSLQAQLASSEAVVREAKAGHDLALQTVQRQRTLAEQGHVSQQRVDEAEAQANTAMARIAAAQAQADTLSVQIDLARITAPYSGVITARMADEGAIASPGMALLELVESGVMEARIGLPQEATRTMKPGQIYPLITDAGTVDAKLRAMTGVIDAGGRTVTSVFEIKQPDQVAVGAVVRLKIERDVAERGVWVPMRALTEASRGLWSVYVAQPDGAGAYAAETRTVEIVHTTSDRAYVRGTLNDGDRVIVDGIQRITPGQPVLPSAAPATTAQKG